MIKTFRPIYENSVVTLRDKNDKVRGYLIEWDGKARFYQGADYLVVRNKDNATPFKFYKDADIVLENAELAEKEHNRRSY